MLKTRLQVFIFVFGLGFLIAGSGIYAAYIVTMEQRAARSVTTECKK